MNSKLKEFLDSIKSFSGSGPTDLVTFLGGLAQPDTLLPPWVSWTLIGLVRHRERQRWVADIIRTRLKGDISELAGFGALGHPEVPQTGPVPGMPEWEYYFHGGGCCVSHKVNGDAIDVDFFDDSADYFDTYFYERYLGSLRQPEPPEARLKELFPSVRAISIAVEDLLGLGAVTPLPGRDKHPFRISNAVDEWVDDIHRFCSAWSDEGRRLALSAQIGDWLMVERIAEGREDLLEIVRPRAQDCRDKWRQRLQVALSDERHGSVAIQALADLNVPDMQSHLAEAILGEPSGKVSAALAVIHEMDDASWCPKVHGLFVRIDPAGKLPSPHIWMLSLKFLIRHEYELDELLPCLCQATGVEIGEAVLLSLEFAPHLTLKLLRNAILNDVPYSRRQVAAILALINAPWSRAELLRSLAVSDVQEKTADARAALLELGDPECERAVLEWEERNPHENEIGSYIEVNGRRLGPFYSFGEMSLKNRSVNLRYEMQELHDRVMKIRHVIPPECNESALNKSALNEMAPDETAPKSRKPWWKIWKRK